ncbi:MAG: RNase H family protein [Saprospiraceae bacterium]
MAIKVYTDGSCHPPLRVGAFVAIIVAEEEIVLAEQHEDTTNNQMELMAVIRSLEYLQRHYSSERDIVFYLDSQYVMRLPLRAATLQAQEFKTKKGKAIRNQLAVQAFLKLFAEQPCQFVKVRAHEKKNIADPLHRKVDFMSRKMVRAAVAALKDKEEVD